MLDRLLDHPPAARAATSFVAFGVAVSHPTAGVALVDPTGELDLLTCPALDRCLRDQLRDPWCAQLILDVSHLGHCGASGLYSLVLAHELARDHHVGLYLVSGPRVSRLLSLTDLADRFVTCADVAVALATASAAVPDAARLEVVRAVSPAPVPRCPAAPGRARLRAL